MKNMELKRIKYVKYQTEADFIKSYKEKLFSRRLEFFNQFRTKFQDWSWFN